MQIAALMLNLIGDKLVVKMKLDCWSLTEYILIDW